MNEDRTVGETERLHPLFLVSGLAGSLRGIAGAYALIGYLAVSGRLGTALIGIVALLLFSAVAVFLYWRRFEYRVGQSEIRIDSGIFSRTHRSIPFDRVQDVDITQGPVARLLGLAQVKFETGASAGQEEGVIQAIALSRAEEIRNLVRARRPGPVAGASAADEADVPPVYALDLKRLGLAGVFNFSLAVFAALFGVTQTMGDVIGFDPLNRDFWVSVTDAGNPAAQFILAHQAAAAIAGLLSLVFVGIATGVVRTTLRDYRFRLDRTGAGLRRRRGLLTLTDVTLPLRRAQAAIVGTGPVRERFGWRELKLQSLARDEGSGDHVLAPLATGEEVNRILAALGWRELAPAIEWQRVSRSYIWSFVIAMSPLLLVLGLQVAVIGLAPGVLQQRLDGPVGPALVPLSIVLLALVGLVFARLLAWRRTGFALDDDRLLIRTGWWRRRTLVLPIRRILSIDLRQNFISRALGTMSVAMGIAGGSGLSLNEIPALDEEKARSLREQLLTKLL